MSGCSDSIGGWLSRQTDLDRLDREMLLCEIMGLSRAAVLARPETPLPAPTRDRLDHRAARLRAGEPLAYVLGHKAFWTLDLKVCPAVLIPRPETELLVTLALEPLRRGDRVLDLGTGSGAIAIAIAATREDAAVTASDRSAEALAVARDNAAAHGVEVRWLTSDWFQDIQGHFEVIVSNPPYVAEGDPHLRALAHEPRHALCAGPDGLADIRRIIGGARSHLAPGGWLMLEHGYDQGSRVRRLMDEAGLTTVETLPDLAGLDRVTRGRSP